MNLYICPKCHSIVEKIVGEGDELFCCETKMELLKEENHSGDDKKHNPLITCKKDTLHIVVGEVIHPMDKNHYIQFILVEIDDYIFRKDLSYGMSPNASFHLGGLRGKAKIYTYCTTHGLWKYEMEV